MAAAIAARKHGASVVLLDEQPAAGGQIYRGITQAPAARLDILGPDYGAGAALAADFAASGARHITGAAVWQVTAERQVHYLQDGGVRSVQAACVLLCTGAMERPFPIPGWTLPGVLTAGAAQILLKGSGMAPTQPVVLAGCGPLLYLLGWQYVRAGVPIAAIVDTTDGADYRRAIRHAGGALAGWRYLQKGLSLMAALKKAGVPFYKARPGCTCWATARPAAWVLPAAAPCARWTARWCCCTRAWCPTPSFPGRCAPSTCGTKPSSAGRPSPTPGASSTCPASSSRATAAA